MKAEKRIAAVMGVSVITGAIYAGGIAIWIEHPPGVIAGFIVAIVILGVYAGVEILLTGLRDRK